MIVLRAIVRQRFGDGIALRRVRDPHGQVGHHGFTVPQVLPQTLIQTFHFLGTFDHFFAFARDNHLAAVPVEDGNVQFFFQSLDVMADGRLGDRQLFGGCHEAAALINLQQRVNFGIEHTGLL